MNGWHRAFFACLFAAFVGTVWSLVHSDWGWGVACIVTMIACLIGMRTETVYERDKEKER